MIRRQKSMRFLGGFYAFPGGKVEGADGSEEALGRCRGVSSVAAAAAFPAVDGIPPLGFWVTAARELVEETGLLVGCDADGRPVDIRDPAVRDRVERLRHALVGEEAPFHVLLAREGWSLDLAPFRYLSHFITPPSSPIRFTARFFLAPVPMGQSPRHFREEASESFWVAPGDGFRRHPAIRSPVPGTRAPRIHGIPACRPGRSGSANTASHAPDVPCAGAENSYRRSSMACNAIRIGVHVVLLHQNLTQLALHGTKRFLLQEQRNVVFRLFCLGF